MMRSCFRFGAPVFISQPHFYQADPYYRLVSTINMLRGQSNCLNEPALCYTDFIVDAKKTLKKFDFFGPSGKKAGPTCCPRLRRSLLGPGLAPDEKKHGSYMRIDPVSGVPIDVTARYCSRRWSCLLLQAYDSQTGVIQLQFSLITVGC